VPGIDAWKAAEGAKETVAALPQLPAGLELPAALPVRYDPTKRVLRCRGFMTSGSYAALHHLSDDVAYLAALDELYVGSSLPRGKPRRWPLMLALLIGLLILAVGAWWWLLR
jgi:hypothetical protein